jgi:integrase
MANIIRENFPRVREVQKNGTTYWVCDARSARHYPDGKEEWFSTQTAALERHKEIKEQLATGTVISPTELAFFREWKTRFAALPNLAADKVLAEMERVLARAVKNWGNKEQEKEKKPTISELCDLWESAKARGDYRKLRPSTLAEIKSTAKLIRREWGENQYDSLKKHHIDDYIKSLTDAHMTTKRKWKVRIQGFCQWCIDNGEGRSNPARGIKIPSTAKDIPATMTLDQVKNLLETCQLDQRFVPLVKFITIGLFAGLRPHEIQRLNPEDIQLEEVPYSIERYKNVGQIYGVIDVKATAAKTGRPRKVVICETLHRFLNHYKEQPIFPKTNFRRIFESLRTNAKFDTWPNDIIRHTSASYFVSKTQDWALTASQYGNSVQVLERYYVDTIHPKQIEHYYSFHPVSKS